VYQRRDAGLPRGVLPSISPVIVGLIWRGSAPGAAKALLRLTPGRSPRLARRQAPRAGDRRSGAVSIFGFGIVTYLAGWPPRRNLRRGGHRQGRLLDGRRASSSPPGRDGLLGHHLHGGHAGLDVPVPALHDPGRSRFASMLPDCLVCTVAFTFMEPVGRPSAGALPVRGHNLRIQGPHMYLSGAKKDQGPTRRGSTRPGSHPLALWLRGLYRVFVISSLKTGGSTSPTCSACLKA
jgi:hypothetical protein